MSPSTRPFFLVTTTSKRLLRRLVYSKTGRLKTQYSQQQVAANLQVTISRVKTTNVKQLQLVFSFKKANVRGGSEIM